jgi:hypothetical protein
MKQCTSFILFMSLSLAAIAQKPVKSVFAEIGGPGFLSANYDMRLSKSNKGAGFRVGLGTVFDGYASGITLPVGINYLAGNNKNFLELGFGVSYVNLPSVNQDQPFNFPKESFLAPYGWLGYRLQPQHKGFTFRAGICPFFKDLNISKVILTENLFAGLSFGYSFQ